MANPLGIDPSRVIREAERLGASEAEVFLVSSRVVRIEVNNNVVDRITVTRRLEAGVRVVVGKRKGNAGGVVSSEADLVELVNRAYKVARVAPEDKSWPGFPDRIGYGAEAKVFDRRIGELDPAAASKLVVDTVEDVSSRGASVSELFFDARASEVVLANSYGGPVSRRYTLLSMYIEVSSGGGSYEDYYAGAKLREEELAKLASRVSERAREASRARSIETGSYTVILEPRVVEGVLSAALYPAFSAENVQEGRSPLSGKLGSRVLSERVTLVDDPTIDWVAGSAPFDDEGVPTTKKTLVEKGILKTYLYNTYTAAREKKESTGNGFRRRPWSDTRPEPTNIIVEVERVDLDEALKDVRKGLIVAATIGQWLSNPISGLATATVTFSYLVERGEVVGVAKGVILSGNIYHLLGDSLEYGVEEVECRVSTCTPGLVISNVSIAGK